MSSKIINSKPPLDKTQPDSFYIDMERLVSCLNAEDREKLEFARYFLNEMQFFNFDGARIQIEDMDLKTFQYFIFSVMLEYESNSWRTSGRLPTPS